MKVSLTQNVGRWVALIFGGALFAFIMLFSIGELFSPDRELALRLGDSVSSLLMALPVAGVTWLAWKKPFWGGVCFLLLAAGFACLFQEPRHWIIWAAFYIPLPLIGLMLIFGGPSRGMRKA